MKKRSASYYVFAPLGAALLGLLLVSAVFADETTKVRPADWAVKLDRPGLPNLHKVNDGLYRGAQPTTEGFRELKKLGVKTVVSFRAHHSDKKLVGDTGIKLESIPMNTWDIEEDDLVRFLHIVNDKDRRPIFVHCQHGADRTGVMCAAYRVMVNKWTKQQAIDEMTTGGFGFHSVWTNIPKVIEKLDVEKVREKAGLEKK
jgi:protein tyrosine/serine phosphatase